MSVPARQKKGFLASAMTGKMRKKERKWGGKVRLCVGVCMCARACVGEWVSVCVCVSLSVHVCVQRWIECNRKELEKIGLLERENAMRILSIKLFYCVFLFFKKTHNRCVGGRKMLLMKIKADSFIITPQTPFRWFITSMQNKILCVNWSIFLAGWVI